MMGKRIYTFEVFGIKGKRIGVTDDLLTEEEMIIKANGILQGAKMFRSSVWVKVRVKGNYAYCLELKG